MDKLWAEAEMVYFPSVTESFGYPVGEARALGLPVLGVDNAQNREIGGKALAGYAHGSASSLAEAVVLAGGLQLYPDPAPFDPELYFRYLIDVETA